jgi:hypothetical protein
MAENSNHQHQHHHHHHHHKEDDASRFKKNALTSIRRKKLISKWLKSEAYTEYCLNMARMYNYRPAN